jgi:hypothetical protein
MLVPPFTSSTLSTVNPGSFTAASVSYRNLISAFVAWIGDANEVRSTSAVCHAAGPGSGIGSSLSTPSESPVIPLPSLLPLGSKVSAASQHGIDCQVAPSFVETSR